MAMKKEEEEEENFIKFCKYYKGEKECPSKYEGIYSTFWSLERKYWCGVTEEFRAEYERAAEVEYPECYPELISVLERLQCKESRGMFAYIVDHFFCMQPYTDLKIFLDYGKE